MYVDSIIYVNYVSMKLCHEKTMKQKVTYNIANMTNDTNCLTSSAEPE